ncbi:MAG: hypothetical protein R3F59_21435 [Myxococcota bacterium]
MSQYDALLAAVRRDPDDAAAWGVLQDWLLAHEDPRGALAQLEGDALVAKLTELLPAWFEREVHPLAAAGGWGVRRHLVTEQDVGVRFAGDDGDPDEGPSVELVFQHGHVRKLVVTTNWDGDREDWGQEWSYPLIDRILSHPVGQVVVDIELRATPYEDFDYAGMVEAVTAHAPLAVRRFYAGDDDQLSWTVVPDARTLWAAAPDLEEAMLEGSQIQIGDPSHPKLRKLHLVSGGLPQEPVHALATAELPALEDLEVWFGSSDYGAECTLADAQRLVERDFPALRRMGLANSEFADALVPLLPTAPWLPRVRELSLWGSALTDDGGRALLAIADALDHLEGLDLSRCYLTEPVQAELVARFGERVKLADQRRPYQRHDGTLRYYASVGE